MDPALLSLLAEQVTLTPRAPPTSGGFGQHTRGAPLVVACRIRGGTKRITGKGGEEVVATHEIRIDGAVMLVPANWVQTLTLTGGGDADTYRLSFAGKTTTPIAKATAAEDVEDALEILTTIGAGNVTVAGATRGPYTITLSGALVAQAQPLLVASPGTNGLAGAVVGVNPDGTPRPPHTEDLATLPDGSTWEIGGVDPANDETGTCVSYRLSTRPA